MENVKKLKFTKEEKEIMEKCQKILSKVCDRINIASCEQNCPFYRLCTKNKLSILDGAVELIENAIEIYFD